MRHVTVATSARAQPIASCPLRRSHPPFLRQMSWQARSRVLTFISSFIWVNSASSRIGPAATGASPAAIAARLRLFGLDAIAALNARPRRLRAGALGAHAAGGEGEDKLSQSSRGGTKRARSGPPAAGRRAAPASALRACGAPHPAAVTPAAAASLERPKNGGKFSCTFHVNIP